MLVNTARHHVLGPLVLLGTLLGLSPVNAGPSAYEEAVTRASRLLPRQPDKIEVVERDEGSHLRSGTAHVEAFVNHGGRVVYLIRQGVTLQATLKGPGIFDYALATVIWHEMAHIDGADEADAQEAEEQLWMGFIVAQRVDRARGMGYLALLKKRRALATRTAGKGPRSSPSKAALAFFEAQATDRIDTFLTRRRPDPLDRDSRAEVLGNLPRYGELGPSRSELAKIAEAERMLEYSARKGVITVKVIDLGYAFTGLHNRTVLLVSRKQLAILGPDEFAALVAHEIGHDYDWDLYWTALTGKDHARRQELELRADGLAVLTLCGMGLDPERLVSAVLKTVSYNDGRIHAANVEDYVPLPERIAFIRAVTSIAWIAASRRTTKTALRDSPR
jgi:hypothetical protein